MAALLEETETVPNREECGQDAGRSVNEQGNGESAV